MPGAAKCRRRAAAAAANVPFALSTVSACSLREVAACGHVPWFQLYFVKDRGFVAELIARRQGGRLRRVVLTVDLAVPGLALSRCARGRRRAAGGCAQLLRAARLAVGRRASAAGRISLGNLEPIVGKRAPLSRFPGWIHANFDASVSWKDVAWVREQWNGPLIIKGILDPDDAREAADERRRRDRRLQPWRPPARRRRCRPRAPCRAIAEAVAGRMPVLVDGGVRSGLDVVRMLALGADFVLLGRAWAYALAARGRGRRRACAEADRGRDAGGDGADRLHQHRRDRPTSLDVIGNQATF